jgi:LysR family transcriptional regulator, glycine cleavage system transcriptional activator
MRSPVHLNALRAFEAAARHGSFSEASEELNVTSAAVGQLVRSLEDWLGTPLFHRSSSGRNRLATTEAADRALPDIRAGLDRLSAGLDRMKEVASGGVLTVTVSPAFAAKWLLPKIDRFQARWPDTDVRLDTSLKLSDYLAQGIDLGVRYGAGSWAGLRAEKLMEEEVFPVCSPSLLSTASLDRPSDLLAQTLIHDLSVDPSVGFETWDTWFRKAGVGEASSPRGLRVNNSAAVLQAAIDGHGVALARSILAADDISSGRLVRLFPEITVPSSLAYYIAYRPERAAHPRLVAFRDWLYEEAQSKYWR